jgi:hypothetical protein
MDVSLALIIYSKHLHKNRIEDQNPRLHAESVKVPFGDDGSFSRPDLILTHTIAINAARNYSYNVRL